MSRLAGKRVEGAEPGHRPGPVPVRMPPRGRRAGCPSVAGGLPGAEVVRQDLPRERPIDVSLRPVEPAVAPYRRLLAAEAKATLRFETPPGQQLQLAWLAAVLMPPSRSAGWRRQNSSIRRWRCTAARIRRGPGSPASLDGQWGLIADLL